MDSLGSHSCYRVAQHPPPPFTLSESASELPSALVSASRLSLIFFFDNEMD